MHRIRPILSALAMLLALVAADTAAGAQDDPCTTVADDDGLHAAGRPTAQGHFPHEEWAVDPGSQRAFGHVHSLLQNTFGVDSKEDPEVTLRKGLIGSVLDHRQRQMVIVVDPDKVDVSDLQPRAEAAAAKAGKGRTNGRPFALVAAGCAGVQDLLSASSVIAERSWHPDAATIDFGYALDPHDSTYHVTFDATDTEAADALEARLGDLVTIEYGEVELRGRMDDGEPHWGGAGIRAYGTSTPTCTAGFTVRYPSGAKGSVTAGHCYSHGTRIYSGPQFYGKVDTSHHPLYDMDRINPAGEVFENKIHVDPCCPSVRRVTGRSNPSLHEFLCVSGMKTRAVCGIEVVSLNYRVCTWEACNLLFLARKPGQLVGQGGDSGAPSYTRPTPSTATIKGMEVAGTRYDNFLGEKVGVIEARLGVTVATY